MPSHTKEERAKRSKAKRPGKKSPAPAKVKKTPSPRMGMMRVKLAKKRG